MTVLVTIDGSERSYAVVPHAAAAARALERPMRVVRVLHPMIDVAEEFGPTVSGAADRVAERWREDLDGWLKARGIEAEAEIDLVGPRESVEDAIIRVAGDCTADLVAMNSRGAGLLHHAIIGSTAMAVVGKCDRPVFLTGPRVEPPAPGDAYRVLVTNDRSKDSDESVGTFAMLLATGRVEVVLAHVYSRATGDRSYEVESADIRAHLESMRPLFAETNQLQTRVFDAEGMESTAHGIIRAAEEAEASAIAMATHGHSVVRHLFAGSTALRVLQHSPLPVILAPV